MSTESEAGAVESQEGVEEKVVSPDLNGSEAEANGKAEAGARGDVSAATIGRMMGLATEGDLKLMESKLDLLATKVNSMTVRMEKVLNILSSAPTGGDLERIDVQVGSLKTLIKEVLFKNIAPEEGNKEGLKNAQIISSSEEREEA